MKSLQHYFASIIIISTLIAHHNTIGMAKKLAIMGALANAATFSTPPIPVPPILEESKRLYRENDDAFVLNYNLNKTAKSGELEKDLIQASDDSYVGNWLFYIGRVANLETRRQQFLETHPHVQEETQTMLDQVCCNSTLFNYIKQTVACCETPDCQPDLDCAATQDWSYVPLTCFLLTEIKKNPCNQTITPLVPTERINPLWRFNDTTSIEQTRQKGATTLSLLTDSNFSQLAPYHQRSKQSDPLDNAQKLYLQLQEAGNLSKDLKLFESGEKEQKLAQVNNNYAPFYFEYINNSDNFINAYTRFFSRNFFFQNDIENFNQNVCCNRTLMEYILKSINCCRDPLCSPTTNCTSIENYKSANSTCVTLPLLREYNGCNQTISDIIPTILQPKRRLSNIAPININESNADSI